MKNKIKENFKSIFKSSVNTDILIERRKKSWLVPLIILLLSVIMMIVPSYISSLVIEKNTLLSNFPNIEEAYSAIVNSGLDCKVNDGLLKCEENDPVLNVIVGDKIKYTVIVNQKDSIGDTSVSFENQKYTDNIVILFEKYIKIRYVQRDYVSESVSKYEIIGDYSKLENFSFTDVSTKINEDSSILKEETANFINCAYKSTLSTGLYASFIAYVIPFLLFFFITSFMLYSPTLFKRKKGFTFSECMKISLTSSIPALVISTLLYVLFKVNIPMILGLIYLIRIVYIYVKYFMSNKNNIYKQLYANTGEERFNL